MRLLAPLNWNQRVCHANENEWQDWVQVCEAYDQQVQLSCRQNMQQKEDKPDEQAEPNAMIGHR